MVMNRGEKRQKCYEDAIDFGDIGYSTSLYRSKYIIHYSY